MQELDNEQPTDVFCNWTVAQRHDDSNRCGWQWDCHSRGMGEGRHEQCAFNCSARTKGDRTIISLHLQHFCFPTIVMLLNEPT